MLDLCLLNCRFFKIPDTISKTIWQDNWDSIIIFNIIFLLYHCFMSLFFLSAIATIKVPFFLENKEVSAREVITLIQSNRFRTRPRKSS